MAQWGDGSRGDELEVRHARPHPARGPDWADRKLAAQVVLLVLAAAVLMGALVSGSVLFGLWLAGFHR